MANQSTRRAARPREADQPRSSSGRRRRSRSDRDKPRLHAREARVTSPTARSRISSRQQYRVPAINLDEYEIDAEVLKLVSQGVCEKHKVIPVSRAGSVAHRRDGRPDEHQRDRRHQVPHRLQHRAGRRERRPRSQTAIERYYNAGPSYDEVMAGFDEDGDRVHRRRRRASTSSSSRRRARTRRSSGSST